MTPATQPGVACYTATRLTLVEALRKLPVTSAMTREALVKMADAILAEMPEASAAAFYMEGVKAERQRILQLAGSEAAKIRASNFSNLDATWAGTLEDFADAIRAQP